MKDILTDASMYFKPQIVPTLIYFLDFPRTADQRVYHLGVCPGEVANRIVNSEVCIYNLSSDDFGCCR